jgi:predicted nucleic acid-binding protein
MAESKKVYLTPSVFMAFVDRADPKHEQASAFFRYFGLEGYMLYTDIGSINQAYTEIYKDISPSLARDFLRTIMLSDINIIYPEESDIKAALKALINFGSTDLSFPNAVVAVLANKRDISQICTFDYLHALFGQNAFFLPI